MYDNRQPQNRRPQKQGDRGMTVLIVVASLVACPFIVIGAAWFVLEKVFLKEPGCGGVKR